MTSQDRIELHPRQLSRFLVCYQGQSGWWYALALCAHEVDARCVAAGWERALIIDLWSAS